MLLNKTTCLCGKDLKGIRFTNYVQNHDMSFYGGRVHMIGTYRCECGRELKGYFSRNIYGELDLIDLEVTEDIAEEEIIENEPISQEENGDNILETNQNMIGIEEMARNETKPKTSKKKK